MKIFKILRRRGGFFPDLKSLKNYDGKDNHKLVIKSGTVDVPKIEHLEFFRNSYAQRKSVIFRVLK